MVSEFVPEQTVALELSVPPKLAASILIITSVEVASDETPDYIIALYLVVVVRLI